MMCDDEVSQVFIRRSFIKKKERKKEREKPQLLLQRQRKRKGGRVRMTLETETGTRRKVELTEKREDLHFKCVLATAFLQLSDVLHV